MNANGPQSHAAQLRRDLAKSARDFDAGSYLQSFLVTTIVAILGTRLFLILTGFPQLGGSGLHIAHMLWGGLLMLAAMVLLLAFIGKYTKRLAAVVGGAGFGLFIDELGKFITADNNYFFQPTIALIYTVLIVLFIMFRNIGRKTMTDEETLANAAEMVREVVIGGATEAEVIRSIHLLDRSKAQGPIADGLRHAVLGAARAAEETPSWFSRAEALAWRAYDGISKWQGFRRAVLALFITESLLGISGVVLMLVGLFITMAHPALSIIRNMPEATPVIEGFLASPIGLPGTVAAVVSSLASLTCAVIGIVSLRWSRLLAYQWLERSVLISIFFVQVILFWLSELAAIGQLAWNLLMLASLRYAIRQEDARQDLQRLDDVATAAAHRATAMGKSAVGSRQ